MKEMFEVKTLQKEIDKINYHQRYISLPDTSISIYKNEKSEIALVEQYRPIIDLYTLEIPGGGVQAGETSEGAAIRELYEETGLIADNITHLLSCVLSVGTSDENVHIYKVITVKNHGNKLESTEIDIKPIWVEYEKCIGMIKSGKIIDAKTIIAIQNI